MKKLVLTAAIAFSGIVGLNAQSMESLQIGARAGYNYSTLRGDTAKDTDVKGLSGYNVGLFVEVPVTERFSIQPEVQYSTQGAKWEGKLLGDSKLKLQYINVPVLAKVYVADGFNIQAGPQFGFKTGADWEYDSKLFNNTTKVNLDDAVSGFDFGLVFGAGYKTPIGLTIDARYDLGLTNVFDKDNESFKTISVSNDNDFKNGVFSIGLGYQF
ncbi:porin family protein [Ornithobacterium rhinotracheale]|uniref:porin family protein n=1 Tax=Ornithobacterium rhinotracheale TaxID=28251 RepID=UPI001FF2FC4B|nr:porin family protein [Ornithobacterium rhinotracheale]MCK0200358.1 PorT family protein [Ornithobacterium rhinotracheale]MCK0205848.1 PorT family protein [Ornithobacterium rhinotracheale]UVD87919.1 PorT family protein [Ornithobacterium rhinotracheale]